MGGGEGVGAGTSLLDRVRAVEAIERFPGVGDPGEHLVGKAKTIQANVARSEDDAPLEESADGVGGEVGALHVEIFGERLDGRGERSWTDSVVCEEDVGRVSGDAREVGVGDLAEGERPDVIPRQNLTPLALACWLLRVGRADGEVVVSDRGDYEESPALELRVALGEEGEESREDALANVEVQGSPMSLDEEEEELNSEDEDGDAERGVGERADELGKRLLDLRLRGRRQFRATERTRPVKAHLASLVPS